MKHLIGLLAGVGWFAPMPPARASEPLAVMILDGRSGGAYHDWRHTTPVLKKELEQTGLFHVEVATAPQDGDLSSFRPKFETYRAVILNYDDQDWPAELKLSLDSYVRGCGGLVVVHAADNAFPEWPEFNRMIGVGGWRGRNETAGPRWYFKNDKLVSDNTPGAAGSHGARLPFLVRGRAPEHPIMKGLPPTWMHTADELYSHLRGPGENLTILATAYSDPANQGTGRDEPVLMALSYGTGRIFHTTMGHDIPALSCVGFIATFQRGSEWAATGKVTQKIPAAFPSPQSAKYNVDLAAMDPAYKGGPKSGAPPIP